MKNKDLFKFSKKATAELAHIRKDRPARRDSTYRAGDDELTWKALASKMGVSSSQAYNIGLHERPCEEQTLRQFILAHRNKAKRLGKLFDRDWIEQAIVPAAAYDPRRDRTKPFVEEWMSELTALKWLKGKDSILALERDGVSWVSALTIACALADEGDRQMVAKLKAVLPAIGHLIYTTHWNPTDLLSILKQLFRRNGDADAYALSIILQAEHDQYRANYDAALEGFKEADRSISEVRESSLRSRAISGSASIYKLQGNTALARLSWAQALNCSPLDGSLLAVFDREMVDILRIEERKEDAKAFLEKIDRRRFRGGGGGIYLRKIEAELNLETQSTESIREQLMNLRLEFDDRRDHIQSTDLVLRAAEIALDRADDQLPDSERSIIEDLINDAQERNSYSLIRINTARISLARARVFELAGMQNSAVHAASEAEHGLAGFGDKYLNGTFSTLQWRIRKRGQK